MSFTWNDSGLTMNSRRDVIKEAMIKGDLGTFEGMSGGPSRGSSSYPKLLYMVVENGREKKLICALGATSGLTCETSTLVCRTARTASLKGHGQFERASARRQSNSLSLFNDSVSWCEVGVVCG